MYQKTTRGVTVEVHPLFLPETSNHEDGFYMWAYHVHIKNEGSETIRLCKRYWHIVDSDGRIQEVRGVGITGDQPHIAPGQVYEYATGTALGSPSAFIHGAYDVQTAAGEWFTVAIPLFSLDSPYHTMTLN